MKPLLYAIVSSVLLPVAAGAQSITPKTIAFTGAPSYSSQELLQATGLAVNTSITKDDIQRAMQRLDDTGLFANMHYTANATSLAFDLTPQPDKLMLPATYTNFVVLDADQITPQVHARVPLFTGKVPNVGNLQQAVQDALVAILKEKGISARVDSVMSTEGGASMSFAIADPPVRMRSLKIADVSAPAQKRMSELSAGYAGQDYDLSSGRYIQLRLSDAYRDLGFLDIAIDKVNRGAPAVTPTAILVDLTTTAHEGGQYRLASFEWPATTVVKAGDFAADAQVKPGEVASRVLVLSTTTRVGGRFIRRGYIDAKVDIAERKDAAAHTVTYAYTVQPGEQYAFQSVRTPGFTPQQQKDFDSRWKLKPGDPYDGEFADSFFQRNASIFAGYSVKMAVEPNRTNHTVTIAYTLTRR